MLGAGRFESDFPLNINQHLTSINIINMKNEVYAAIAMALYEFNGNNVHDKESGIITIAEKLTQWNGYALTMTEHP
jgi:hypothetical protein